MNEGNKKPQQSFKEDIHGTPEVTRWVHKHRFLSKWIMRALVAGVSLFLYFLKKEEKKIEKEANQFQKAKEVEK